MKKEVEKEIEQREIKENPTNNKITLNDLLNDQDLLNEIFNILVS